MVTDVFIDPSRVTLRGDGLSLIEALLVPLLREDHVEAVVARRWARSHS